METYSPTKKSTKQIKNIKDIGYLNIKFEPIEHSLSLVESGKLNTNYVGEIFLEPRDSSEQILVGKVEFIHVNLSMYINREMDENLDNLIGDIDHDVYLIYQTLFDYESTELSEEAAEEIGDDFVNSNFVVISNIEVLPEYRNYDIGKMVIKFAIDFFSDSVSYIFLKSFPKQNELFENSDPWRTQMGYQEMHKKFIAKKQTAQQSLDKFYSKYMDKIKFYKGEGSIFYINMAHKNKI